MGDSDVVNCGYRRDANVSKTSGEAFGAWLGHHVRIDWDFPSTQTTAHDPIRFDFAASRNFVGHVGGGGGSRAIYDPRHRVLALCQRYDTAQAFFLFEHVPPPPFPVAIRDLAGFKTARGIRLGSTIADVRTAYGFAAVTHFSGPDAGLSYERSVPVQSPRTVPTFTPLTLKTWFDVVDGRVTSIERLTGF